MKSYAGALVAARRERERGLLVGRPLPRRRTRCRPVLLGAVIEHLCISIIVGPLVGTHTAVAFPHAPPMYREAAPTPTPPFPQCSRVSLLWSPRCMPPQDHSLGYCQLLLPPPYTPRSDSALFIPPRPLLPLFPSMTPPPRYVSPSPMTSVVGPPLAPRLSLQSTLRLPLPSPVTPPPLRLPHPCVFPPPLTLGPTLWVGCRPCLLLGRLDVILHWVGFVTSGVSVAGESPWARPLRTMTLVLYVSKPCLLQPPRGLHFA